MADRFSLKKKFSGEVYNASAAQLLKFFDSSQAGLSFVEAERRLQEYGKNKIKKQVGWRKLRIIVGQFKDVLIWILLVAAGLAFFFGEIRDVVIILLIVLINALVGFFQEFKAEKILDKLKKLVTDKTLVIREGEKREIETAQVVLGDVIFLSAGDDVPADGYLLDAYDLKINSFIFSGESKDELRKAGVMREKKVALADIHNMVFLGESVVNGEGRFLVTATGMETELGKIAALTEKVQEGMTPLQHKMKKLGKKIAILAASIGLVMLAVGYFFQMDLYKNFLFALALAVSVVPEGLPAAISVALSMGMKKLLKRNVLVKKLSAVETLGSVSIICTDKTGTITKNELAVVKVILANKELDLTGNGYQPVGEFFLQGEKIDPRKIKNLEEIFRIGALCNDASLIHEQGKYKIIGDPTEGAIVVAGKKFESAEGFFERGEIKIGENPFSSGRRRMSVIYQNKQTISYVKGSPDVLIDLCRWIKIDDRLVELSDKEREKIKEKYNQLSQKALRVLAFAQRDLSEIANQKIKDKDFLQREAEKDLIWIGMLAMTDPPRKEVAGAIKECRELGVRPMMITGDYEITARAIAEEIGLLDAKASSKKIISGKELNFLKDREIYQRIQKGACVFARISPSQKLRIASILIQNKQIIAMTGDGVNDAPALKKADIGVAMGVMGTDVSKEAADMILLDDNFASIISGIREGRTIFANLRKFVYYVFSSNSSELLVAFFGFLIGIPAPITAIQILSIDLATDVFPSFSLGVEPPEKEIEGKISKNKQKELLDFSGFKRIVSVGIVMAIGGVVAFLWSMKRGGWHLGESIVGNGDLYIKSTAATYAVLAMAQMANLLQARSETVSPFRLGFFKNKYAIGSIFLSLGILLIFLYGSFFQKYLRLAPIDKWDWLMVGATFLAVFLFEEARKWWLNSVKKGA